MKIFLVSYVFGMHCALYCLKSKMKCPKAKLHRGKELFWLTLSQTSPGFYVFAVQAF